MYKNILVAIDLSPRSKLALEKAIKFAHIFNISIKIEGEITLLNYRCTVFTFFLQYLQTSMTLFPTLSARCAIYKLKMAINRVWHND